jgi:hypothetical protein
MGPLNILQEPQESWPHAREDIFSAKDLGRFQITLPVTTVALADTKVKRDAAWENHS